MVDQRTSRTLVDQLQAQSMNHPGAPVGKLLRLSPGPLKLLSSTLPARNGNQIQCRS